MSAALVELIRSGLVDEIHRGDLAVVSADGELRFAVGDPLHKVAFWRSSAKPFQAVPLIASGAAERLGLTSEDIALIAASHGGEPLHVERVASLLARTGHRVEDLECGAHAPLDAEAARELERHGEAPTALHNNCSGKHAGLLALADELGAPFPGYRLPGHPVQDAILESVGRFTGLEQHQIAIGLDGCGVPCFGISIYRMALAFARLLAPGDEIPEAFRDAAGVVRGAMMRHPYLVAGRKRIDTDLMSLLPGAILSKVGAGGVHCIGLPGGIGVAVKIEDGAGSTPPGGAAGVAALEALRQLEVLDAASWVALEDYARPAIRSVAGEHAGNAQAAFELRRPATRT
jgi:L-asparaginase II